ncbi:MAG TPA: hypothetical protein VGV09_20285, partial [Steroidobacteraceae bacterium]|nr:hypothetical protein [Steroidobacteraceae bacterium]
LWVTPLPADAKEVARITCFGDRFEDVWKRAGTAFRVVDGYLWHDDLEAHRQRAERLHEQRVSASTKAVLARTLKSGKRMNGISPSGEPVGDSHD